MRFEATAPHSARLLAEDSSGVSLRFVLPHKVAARLERRTDSTMRVYSGTEAIPQTVESESGAAEASSIMSALIRELQSRGHRLNGFDLRLQGAIPHLGGEAAQIAATLKVLRSAYELPVTDIEIARILTGLLPNTVPTADALCSALGRPSEAILANVRSFEFERILLPMELLDLTLLWPEDEFAPSTEFVNEGDALAAATALRERDVKRFGTILSTMRDSTSGRYESIVEVAKSIPEIVGLRLPTTRGPMILVTKPRTGRDATDELIRAVRHLDPSLRLQILWS